MPGMPTGGIVSIPKNCDLRESNTGTGAWLNFKVLYSDRDHTNKHIFHMYKASMWVPNKDLPAIKDSMISGAFFRITAHIDARVKEEQDFDPIPQLRIDHKYFTPIKIGKLE